MWQNPYASNYNPMVGLVPPGNPPNPTPTGQTNFNQFSSGVISPPPNANPFQPQPDIQAITQPVIPPSQPGNVLQPPIVGQMGQMVVDAFENFKKSVVDSKEDGDNMVLTVRIPTQILKQDPNFSFLFK